MLHGLKGAPHILDIRNCGLIGALQLAPRDGDATIRGFEIGMKLWKKVSMSALEATRFSSVQCLIVQKQILTA